MESEAQTKRRSPRKLWNGKQGNKALQAPYEETMARGSRETHMSSYGWCCKETEGETTFQTLLGVVIREAAGSGV